MDLTGNLQGVFDAIPRMIENLLNISPWIAIALIVGAIIRFSIVPLIKAWRNDK
jgi:hypothetical protein